MNRNMTTTMEIKSSTRIASRTTTKPMTRKKVKLRRMSRSTTTTMEIKQHKDDKYDQGDQDDVKTERRKMNRNTTITTKIWRTKNWRV